MVTTDVDVIFLSLGDSDENRAMTMQAIETLLASETYARFATFGLGFEFDYPVRFRIIVVESYRTFLSEGHSYPGTTVIIPGEEFNFHRFLKYGIDYCREFSPAPWTVLANNDLIFHMGWMSEIIKQHQLTGIRSFGTWCDRTHGPRYPGERKAVMEGHRVSYEYTGWNQVFRTDLLHTLDLREHVMFWYSDNVLVDQLKARKERHALLRDSKVTHLESVTINKFDRKKLHHFTRGQTIGYKKHKK